VALDFNPYLKPPNSIFQNTLSFCSDILIYPFLLFLTIIMCVLLMEHLTVGRLLVDTSPNYIKHHHRTNIIQKRHIYSNLDIFSLVGGIFMGKKFGGGSPKVRVCMGLHTTLSPFILGFANLVLYIFIY